MDGRADLVLAADRHLKWRALDPLERILMQLCGVCLIGFTSTTLLDVVAQSGRPPAAVAARGDLGVLHLRRLHRRLGRDAA